MTFGLVLADLELPIYLKANGNGSGQMAALTATQTGVQDSQMNMKEDNSVLWVIIKESNGMTATVEENEDQFANTGLVLLGTSLSMTPLGERTTARTKLQLTGRWASSGSRMSILSLGIHSTGSFNVI